MQDWLVLILFLLSFPCVCTNAMLLFLFAEKRHLWCHIPFKHELHFSSLFSLEIYKCILTKPGFFGKLSARPNSPNQCLNYLTSKLFWVGLKISEKPCVKRFDMWAENCAILTHAPFFEVILGWVGKLFFFFFCS